MNDEIKEILDDLRNKDCYINNEITLTFDEAKDILDCITNLQEIAEEHKNCTRKHWQQKCAEHCANEMIYKSRIDKAIEYINENKHLSMFADCREPEKDWNYDLEINPRDLLKILNGDDE